jgi:hypothetical protein
MTMMEITNKIYELKLRKRVISWLHPF